MNPSEAWSLLTIRSQDFRRVPGGHGSMSMTDVAALLAGLEREPFLMGMAAECGDYRSLLDLERVLWVRTNGIATRENWEEPRRGEFTYRRMAGLALYEAIDDRTCFECTGKGRTSFALEEHPGLIMAKTFEPLSALDGSIECAACRGSGRVALSGRKKADLAGINKDMWTRVWARRYESVFRLAHGWRDVASRYLAAKVRELDEVDTERKTAKSECRADSLKNPLENSRSCDLSELHGKSRPGRGAPEENSTPIEVDFRAMKRTILKLNTPRKGGEC